MDLIALIFVGSVIALIICFALMYCSLAHEIKSEMDFYMDENYNIKEQINCEVRKHLKPGQKLIDFSYRNAASFLSFYPELGSDSTVQQQIATYMKNHDTLLELMARKRHLVMEVLERFDN